MDQYSPYDQRQSQPRLSYQSVPLHSPTLRPQTTSLPSFPSSSKEGFAEAPMDAQRAQQKARTKRPTGKILLYSSGVLLLTLAPTIVLLAYIFIFNTAQHFGGTILTTASLPNILAVTQVITTVVSKSVGVVCTVWAYQAAAAWLKSSQQPGSTNRPSPLQLGLLISVLQGASIVAWVRSRWHIARITEDSKRHALQIPGVLSSAIFVLGTLLVLSNALTATDTWLHLSSRAATVGLNSDYPNPESAEFGRTVNETLCSYWRDLPSSIYYPSTYDMCGLATQSAGSGYRHSLPEGLRTMNNASNLNSVAFTTDSHAIIVPASVPNDISYTASTTGVFTSCASISNQCITPKQGFDGGMYYDGSDATGIYFDCTKAHPYVNLTTFGSYTGGLTSMFGVVNRTTGNMGRSGYEVDSNPFMFAGVLVSSAYSDITGRWYDPKTGSDWINNTGFFSYESLGGTNIMTCNISVRDIQYKYTVPDTTGIPRYDTISAKDSPVLMATRLATMIYAGTAASWVMQQRVAGAVEGAGIEEGDYAAAFATEFSRELMALSASLWQPQSVQSITTTQLRFGSKIQVAPLGVYLVLTVLYCLTTLIVGVMAIIKSIGTPYVDLAQYRITSPLALLHALFGPVDATRTWREDGLGVFSRESEADRLLVGPVATPKGDVAFGVTRQPS